MAPVYNPDTLRKQLNKQMRARGWTPKTLSEASGVHVSTIRDALAGRVQSDLPTMYKLARGLEVTIDELVSPETKGKSEEQLARTLYETAIRMKREDIRILITVARGLRNGGDL